MGHVLRPTSITRFGIDGDQLWKPEVTEIDDAIRDDRGNVVCVLGRPQLLAGVEIDSMERFLAIRHEDYTIDNGDAAVVCGPRVVVLPSELPVFRIEKRDGPSARDDDSLTRRRRGIHIAVTVRVLRFLGFEFDVPVGLARPRVEGDRELQILEATLEVLAEVGYTAEQIEKLHRDGVLKQAAIPDTSEL